MNLSQIKRTHIVKTPVRVDKKNIIIYYNDDNLKIWKSVYDSNFFLNNCKGIICPNKMWTIYKKKYNGKHHYLDLKRKIMENKDATRKLKILASIPDQIKKTAIKEKKSVNSQTASSKDFYFYDTSMISEAIQNLLNRNLNERIVYSILLKELTSIYDKIKYANPNINVQMVFHLNTSNGPLFKFLKNIKRYQNVFSDELENKLFDTFGLAVINGITIPVLETVEGSIKGIFQNIKKLEALVGDADKIETESDIEPLEKNPNKKNLAAEDTPSESIVTKIAQHLANPNLLSKEDAKKLVDEKKTTRNMLRDTIVKKTAKKKLQKSTPPKVKVIPKKDSKPIKTTTKINDKNEIKIELDAKTFRKVLKYYKITNPDVVANVKNALDKYISESDKKTTQDEASLVVLKAINYTVHGTDDVDEKYIRDPSSLIRKISEMDVYKQALNLPKGKIPSIEPSEIIGLEYTTGQHRQKFEFEEMIHENVKKVFGALETQNIHPIKVKSVKWDYKDTDTERYTNYDITLQNLDGVNKNPYKVEVKVPAPVNDKYFKLNGQNYVFLSQQHMKPLTKTDKNEVRILSNYAIVRLSVENLKFNIADIFDLLDYVNKKYPNIIEEVNDKKHVKFLDGDIAYFIGDIVFKNEQCEIVIDPETSNIIEKGTDKVFKSSRFEFIYEQIMTKIAAVNPDDKLTKTKKSIPYINIYISGQKVPLIIYMWTQKGLLSSLNTFGIDYEVSDKKGKRGELVVEMEGNKFLYIKPTTIKERLVANGLLKEKPRYPIKDLDNKEEIHDFLIDAYNTRTIGYLDNATQNLIDPVTKELLDFENLPTNLPALAAGPALDKLLNDKQDSLADLKIYRSRMSEIILRLMYKQLLRAHGRYARSVDIGEDDKLMIVPDFIINEFLGRNPRDQTLAKDAILCRQEMHPVKTPL